MPVTLFHNPKCSTSRNALALLREKGVEPRVVEYVKTGWDRATLERLAAKTGAGVAGLLRKKEAEAAVLLAAGADDEAIIAAAVARPILIERPIVESDTGAVIGRPVERVLDVL
jgi:arsenate reductase (glutaredoxin)